MYKGKETGEMALARPMLNCLIQSDLLLGDRYYPSFFMMAKLHEQNVAGVFQIQGSRNFDFRLGDKLGELDHIVFWDKPNKPEWMSKEEYDSFPAQIKIRETDVTNEINSDDRFVLVTNLLDAEVYPKKDLAELYRRRWEIETGLKEIKDIMGMDHINAKTPESVKLLTFF